MGDAVETLGTNLSTRTEASWETLKRHWVTNLSTNTEASWETLKRRWVANLSTNTEASWETLKRRWVQISLQGLKHHGRRCRDAGYKSLRKH